MYKDFVHNKDLSYEARMLWMVMHGFSSREHSCVWPSIMTLRGLMTKPDANGEPRALSRNKLFSLLKELETCGYLKRQLRKKGKFFTSALYTLMDEPFFGADDGDLESTFSWDAQNRDAMNKDAMKRDRKVCSSMEGGFRGRGGSAPTEGTEKKKKNRGAAPHPAGAGPGPHAPSTPLADPGGSESSSSFACREGGGSAPRTPGTQFPEALIQEGKRRGPEEDDPVEVKADFFLYLWRKYQFKVLGKYPVLTERDQKQAIAWIRDAQPLSLKSYLALAVVAWETKARRERNGYRRYLVTSQHSRTLSSFLRNVDKIDAELAWDHDDEDSHRQIIKEVVSIE